MNTARFACWNRFGCPAPRRVLVTILDEPPVEAQTSEVPAQTTKAGRLLALLDKLERLPRSSRTTEEMNADIQAERDAWER
jgi:hypothetical protein